ncbi:Low temperature viability protein [Dipodascopsis tothii]|uniref:Low temperature viability protein n=1 Tax=Dipodascopsis tothii TaxID=44089 RepID=UPI0034CEF48C
MQHLREIGTHSDAVFVAAPTVAKKKAPAGPVAFREGPGAVDMIPKDMFPSAELERKTYQDQQAVPDAIAGLQPDMDPSLREVLEALEDEEYVDADAEDDLFSALVGSGRQAQKPQRELSEYEKMKRLVTGLDAVDLAEDDDEYVDGDDFWSDAESDGTAKGAGDDRADWEKEFAKFKKDQGRRAADSDDEAGDDVGSLVSFAKRKGKARAGPRTMSSGYSMSSSSIFRNEKLTLLDDQFERIERQYANDDDDDDALSDTSDTTVATMRTGVSRKDAPVHPARMQTADLEQISSFNDIMDDFLDNYDIMGKKLVKRSSKKDGGLKQYDELRQQLGKPDLKF